MGKGNEQRDRPPGVVGSILGMYGVCRQPTGEDRLGNGWQRAGSTRFESGDPVAAAAQRAGNGFGGTRAAKPVKLALSSR